MSELILLAVGKDANIEEWPDGALCLVNFQKSSLSAIGNRWLEASDRPVFGLCHADVVFGPGALEVFTAEAMRGAVCGIVGARLDGSYRCCYVEKDSGEVSTLDGMAVFFRKDLGLRFDEKTFDGFHCHVEDLCLQAHAKGIPVTVPAADAHHRNHESTGAWLDDYRKYRARLAEKWKGTEFRTT